MTGSPGRRRHDSGTLDPGTLDPGTLDIRPVGPAQWADVAALFGPNGAISGCWCMWWRVSASQWAAGNDANRAAFGQEVGSGAPVGVLAYLNAEPVGWCAVAPRPAYPRILRSPHLKPTDPDEAGVWSVTCFFVKRGHRRRGISGALLDAAVAYARRMGAATVEGYPVDNRSNPGGDVFTGTVTLFERAGFIEHAARGGRRVVMRRTLDRRSGG